MAEADQDDKTEEPTGRRLQKAREDGQVPRSKELNTAAVLILGAVGLLAKDGIALDGAGMSALAIGFVTAMVVGYLALVMLVALVRRGGLHRFAWYVWPVGLAALFLG